jgi:hypothetical protein
VHFRFRLSRGNKGTPPREFYGSPAARNLLKAKDIASLAVAAALPARL